MWLIHECYKFKYTVWENPAWGIHISRTENRSKTANAKGEEMSDSIESRTVGMIHAVVFTVNTIQPFINTILPQPKVLHIGDDTIQDVNLRAGIGNVPPDNYRKFTGHAANLTDAGADLIILMCSTFNRAVEYAQPMIKTPMLQIDRPMMDLAVAQGSRVGLLATLPMTVPASKRLLEKAAYDAGKDIKVETVLEEEAFKVLREGNVEGHNEILLERSESLSKEVDAIVMAQLSMAVLEEPIENPR